MITFDVENNPDSSTTGGGDPSGGGGGGGANDNAPMGWSAELRPNPGGAGGSDSPWARDDTNTNTNGGGNRRAPREPRMFRDNALTQLPASLAAGILARRAASLLLAPLEGASVCQVARLWCRARGLPTAGVLWDPVWLWWPFAWRRGGGGRGFFGGLGFFGGGWGFTLGAAGFSLNSVVSLVGLELVHTLFDACMWCSVPLIVSRYLLPWEEWERRMKAEEAREQARLQLQMDRTVEEGLRALTVAEGVV